VRRRRATAGFAGNECPQVLRRDDEDVAAGVPRVARDGEVERERELGLDIDDGPSFGRDFQSTFFRDWLEWTGVADIEEIRYHPTLTGDSDAALAAAIGRAERIARRPTRGAALAA
jgi:hypothetical protein